MKIEWVLLAEGVGMDAKGAITAIGLNQNVFATPSLPAATKRVIIAHLVADHGALKTGDKLAIRFSVTSPSGQVVAAQSAQAAIGQLAWPDLPPSSDLSAELGLSFYEYGTHLFQVNVRTDDGSEIKGEVEFYVVRPPVLNVRE